MYLLIRYFTFPIYCVALAGSLDKLCSFYTRYTERPHELKITDQYQIIDC